MHTPTDARATSCGLLHATCGLTPATWQWDKDDEREAMERLSRLAMWERMSPEMVEKMMSAIRKNPKRAPRPPLRAVSGVRCATRVPPRLGRLLL